MIEYKFGDKVTLSSGEIKLLEALDRLEQTREQGKNKRRKQFLKATRIETLDLTFG